jgi:hypothetical protein
MTAQISKGIPGSFLIWKLLERDGYAHYRDHMQSIRAWLERSTAHQ